MITILGSSSFREFLACLLLVFDCEATGGKVLILAEVTDPPIWLEEEMGTLWTKVSTWPVAWTDIGQLREAFVVVAVVWIQANGSRPVTTGCDCNGRDVPMEVDVADMLVWTSSLFNSAKTLLTWEVCLQLLRRFLFLPFPLSKASFKEFKGDNGFSFFNMIPPPVGAPAKVLASSISLPSSIPDSEDDELQSGDGDEAGEGDAGQLSDMSESRRDWHASSRLGNPSDGTSITGKGMSILKSATSPIVGTNSTMINKINKHWGRFSVLPHFPMLDGTFKKHQAIICFKENPPLQGWHDQHSYSRVLLLKADMKTLRHNETIFIKILHQIHFSDFPMNFFLSWTQDRHWSTTNILRDQGSLNPFLA